MDRDDVTGTVRDFYDALPFNYQSAASGASLIHARNQIAESYPDLNRTLSSARTVLDVGCGTGWLANTCAYHYRCSTSGVDLSATALDRAREISSLLGVSRLTHFRRLDLFELDGSETYDIVASLGVLHHAANAAAAVRAISRCVGRDGVLYLGLYHARGRKPFLEHFAPYRERAANLTEAELNEAFRLYRALDSRSTDPVLLRSWFRDQVLHPHETQHTLAEIAALLETIGFEVTSTSINRFEPFTRLEDLFELEAGYEEHARQRLSEGSYLPGYFTVQARRADA
jgi:SAM-dependent methyltransferase